MRAYLKSIKLRLSLAKQCFYEILFSLISPSPLRLERHTIIIIRTDAIGDYLLFRNFLTQIREHYPTSHITLLGNPAWSELSMHLDKMNIDCFLWLNPRKFTRNPFYAIRLMYQLKSKRYSLLINPIHSRDRLNELLAKHILADSKAAPKGDNVNNTPALHTKAQSTYTILTESSPKILFEFYRNKEFFSALLGGSHTKLTLDINALPESSYIASIPKPYSVLFIGASAAYRKYSIEHLSLIASHLVKTHNQHIVLCGGKEDIQNAQKLEQLIQHKLDSEISESSPIVTNLVGVTTLSDLARIVYNGNLLVSNETSAAHLCAILDTTILIVVSNGNHLGRFIPYPKDLRDKYYPVFHHFIEDNLHKYEELSNAFAYKSTLNINEINPTHIINMIDKALSTNAPLQEHSTS